MVTTDHISAKDGEHYFFVPKEQFEADIRDGKFLEHAQVHNNYYGTSIASVARVAESGRCCILDIDTQGARQVRAAGLRAIYVFVAPPSVEELAARLRGRGTESEEQVACRLTNAKAELDAYVSLTSKGHYETSVRATHITIGTRNSANEPGLFDYVLVNDDVDTAAAALARIGARALAGELGPEPSENTQPSETTQPQQQKHEEETAPAPSDAKPGTATPEAATAAPPVAATPHHETNGVHQDPPMAADPTQPLYLGTYEQHRDKIAVVTGAASVPGSALCRALALAGLRVVALARTRESLQSLQRELILEAGVSASNFLPIVCDTTKEAELVAVPRIVAKRWPDTGVDILVHIEVH